MKKLINILTILIIIFNICMPVYADDEDESLDNDIQIKENIVEASTIVDKTPKINSRAAVIYDRTSKTVIWGKNENTKRAMASTTKIMTAIIVLENANLTDTVEISRKAAGTGGSRLGLKYKDKVTVNDLLYGLMLRSGNDSAVALAEYIGEDIEGFAKLMNNKAKEIGLKNTSFVTPHGLDAIEHYTTAYELAIITDYALNNNKFSQIVNTKSTTININGNSKNISNTNELLGNLTGVNGVKTGFTNNAGRCLVTSTSRNGHQIICVVLGADTKKHRTTDSVKLIEYAFSNYEYINIKKMIEQEFKEWLNNEGNNIKINKAQNKQLQINTHKMKIEETPIDKNFKKDVKVEIVALNELEAPIAKNQKIGTVNVKVGNNIIASTDIIIENEINKKGILSYFMELIKEYAINLENNI